MHDGFTSGTAKPVHPQLSTVLLTLCIAAIGLFQFLTIRDGHDWGDDFAMYIRHARNLSEGRPYSDTGYLYNPENPNLGPRLYPPVTPILLLPVYKFAGFSLRGMKAVMVLSFLIALVMAYKIGRRYLPWQWALALVLAIGFNPLFRAAKEVIGSDLPFLFMVLATLYFADRIFSGFKTSIPKLIGLGVLIYLSCATRSVGLILIPTLLIYGLIRRKPGSAVVVSGIAMLLIAAQGMILPPAESSVLQLFANSPIHVLLQCFHYLLLLPGLWRNGVSKLASLLISAGSLLLFCLGLEATWRKQVRVYDIFAACYLLLISAFIEVVPRYMFPLEIYYLLYVVVGAFEVKSRFPRRYKLLAAAVAAVVVLSYTANYATRDWSPKTTGISDPQYREMCRFVEGNTDANARLIAGKPRLLALMTGRTVAAYSGLAELPSYMNKIGATLVLTGGSPANDDLVKYCAERPDMFHVVQRIGPFVLYRFQSDPHN